jgi:hypothetical protein
MAAVVAVAVLMLGAYGQFWAIVPLTTGAALGAALLWGMERVVRKAFTADAVLASRRRPATPPDEDAKTETDGKKTWVGKRALLAFALIKYPMVALLLWAISRHWDDRSVMVFLSGFVLLQVVIGLRGLGRYLVPSPSAPRSSGGRRRSGGV